MNTVKLHRTVGVRVGGVQVGGGAPVVVQSMTMTDTAVAAASAVSVIVIDWTTTGAPPPTWTPPTRTPTVLCSFTVFMSRLQDDHSTRMSAQPDTAARRLNGVSLALRVSKL